MKNLGMLRTPVAQRLLISFSLCTVSAAAAPTTKLNDTQEVLWVANQRIVAQEKAQPKRIHIYSRGLNFETTLTLENGKVAAYNLSPDERLLAVSESVDAARYGTRIFDLQDGRPIFEVERIKSLRSIFWIAPCRLAVLSSVPSATGVDHKVQVFEVPTEVVKKRKLECFSAAADTLAQTPLTQKLPQAFYSDGPKHWGVYDNADKGDFNWIGTGDISALRPGRFPYFYYLSGQSLMRADVSAQKIQPIANSVLNFYPSQSKDTLVVLQTNGMLQKLTVKGGTYDRKVVRKQGVKEVWMGDRGEWALLRTATGNFEIESLK